MSRRINKKAISLMLSYVILIVIVISLSVAVYAWVKTMLNLNPSASCKEGTSLILDSYECSVGSPNLKLTFSNNGRFNIEGVLVAVGNDSRREPTTYLVPNYAAIPTDVSPGHYFFPSILEPGATKTAEFTNRIGIDFVPFKNITIIKVQAFIFYNNRSQVLCDEAILSEKLASCQIKA